MSQVMGEPSLIPLESLVSILDDPAHRGGSVSVIPSSQGEQKVISATGRIFPVKNGILEMYCPDLEPPDPHPRNDPEWELWKTIYPSLIRDFSYSGIGGLVQELGHLAAASSVPRQARWILEIGSGASHHLLRFSHRYPANCNYINLDAQASNLEDARSRWVMAASRGVRAGFVKGSVYNLPFLSHSLDHVVSIYVYEHLFYLEQAISEMTRVLKPGGTWSVVLPTEGGTAWSLGRKLTFSRKLRKKYGLDYERIMSIEHCNSCARVIRALRAHLTVRKIRHLPFLIPSIDLNAVVMVQGKV